MVTCKKITEKSFSFMGKRPRGKILKAGIETYRHKRLLSDRTLESFWIEKHRRGNSQVLGRMIRIVKSVIPNPSGRIFQVPQSQPKFQSKSRTFFHSLIEVKSTITSLCFQILRPVTGTIDSDNHRMVYHSIQDGRGHGVIGKDIPPLFERFVGGNDK